MNNVKWLLIIDEVSYLLNIREQGISQKWIEVPKSVMFYWFALIIEPRKQMVSATLSDRETTLIQYRRNPATCRLLELSFCFVQFLRCRSSTIIAQSKFKLLSHRLVQEQHFLDWLLLCVVHMLLLQTRRNFLSAWKIVGEAVMQIAMTLSKLWESLGDSSHQTYSNLLKLT